MTNKNRGLLQNPVRMIKKTDQLSTFELSDSIYFIFGNIFFGVLTHNIEDVLL